MNYALALVECASTEKYAEGLEICCGVALNNNALRSGSELAWISACTGAVRKSTANANEQLDARCS